MKLEYLMHLGLLMAVVGCQAEAPRPASPAADPPPVVTAKPATTRLIVDYREFTGRTAAVESVEVRARVSGYILQSPRGKLDSQATAANEAGGISGSPNDAGAVVEVDEGQLVKAGELLFVIDPQPYELALQQSQGSLAAAEARLKQANQDLGRVNELLTRNASSRADYDQAVAAVAELAGQIENLRATVARHELDLDYTRVRSPIGGLLGRSEVTAGNLVVADTTILTTVVAADPIYVNFDVDEQSLLNYRKRILTGEVKSARNTEIEVRLGLANEDGFPHVGTIDFVNNTTNPTTGNTQIRGKFDNAAGVLSPGLFARIQVPFTAPYEAVLVPASAIAMDQQGRYVMIVGPENKVLRREVELGRLVDEQTVIRKGVAADELVVTSGLQKIRPGATVRLSAEDEE